MSDNEGFIPSSEFVGPIIGWLFKAGPNGLGYHRERRPLRPDIEGELVACAIRKGLEDLRQSKTPSPDAIAPGAFPEVSASAPSEPLTWWWHNPVAEESQRHAREKVSHVIQMGFAENEARAALSSAEWDAGRAIVNLLAAVESADGDALASLTSLATADSCNGLGASTRPLAEIGESSSSATHRVAQCKQAKRPRSSTAQTADHMNDESQVEAPEPKHAHQRTSDAADQQALQQGLLASLGLEVTTGSFAQPESRCDRRLDESEVDYAMWTSQDDGENESETMDGGFVPVGFPRTNWDWQKLLED